MRTLRKSLPVGFACGWLATILSGRRSARRARERYACIEQVLLAGPPQRRPSWSDHQ
ncbi:hypothetical protein ACGFXB_23315 [Streptomyces canus]|uniref:hypothetical protein n=1 Tax=Streptomyces canus TaxID=58343 RepID=UPI0037214E84